MKSIKIVTILIIIVGVLYMFKPKEKASIIMGNEKAPKKNMNLVNSEKSIAQNELPTDSFTKNSIAETPKKRKKKRRKKKSNKAKKISKKTISNPSIQKGKGRNYLLSFEKDNDVIKLLENNHLEIYFKSQKEVVYRYYYSGNVIKVSNNKLNKLMAREVVFKNKKLFARHNPQSIYVKLRPALNNRIDNFLVNNKNTKEIMINESGNIIGGK